MATSGMPPDAATQLEELSGLFGYWKTVSGLLTPVVALLSGWGLVFDSLVCPGAEKLQSGIAFAITLVALVSLYCSFRKADAGAIDRSAKFLICLGLISACLYIVLLLNFVVEVDDRRYLTGFTLTTRAQQALDNKELNSTSPKALLDYFGHASEDDIWTLRVLAKVALFLTFIVTFAATAGALFLWTLKSFVHDRVAMGAARQVIVPPAASSTSPAPSVPPGNTPP